MTTSAERRELISKLEANRQKLMELARELDDDKLKSPNKEGDRSPKGMLMHLAQTEHSYVFNWAKRARDENSPDLKREGGEGGGEAPLFNEANPVTVDELISSLEKSRLATLRFVAETSDEEFERVGRNTPFGDLTVHQFLKSLYRHDQMHIDEIIGVDSAYEVRTTDGRRL